MECFGKIYSAQISINWRHILFGGSLDLCISENLLQDLSILVLFLKNRSLSTRRGSNTTKRKLSLAPSEKTVTWALLGKCEKQANRRLKRNRRPGWMETDTLQVLLNFLTIFIWHKNPIIQKISLNTKGIILRQIIEILNVIWMLKKDFYTKSISH